jgi:hypothetical protein
VIVLKILPDGLFQSVKPPDHVCADGVELPLT